MVARSRGERVDSLALAQVNDIAQPGRGRFVVAEDLDGDGQLDLLVAADAAASGVAGGASALTAYLDAGVPGILGDLDGDGVVGAFDLAILLGSWSA